MSKSQDQLEDYVNQNNPLIIFLQKIFQNLYLICYNMKVNKIRWFIMELKRCTALMKREFSFDDRKNFIKISYIIIPKEYFTL